MIASRALDALSSAKRARVKPFLVIAGLAALALGVLAAGRSQQTLSPAPIVPTCAQSGSPQVLPCQNSTPAIALDAVASGTTQDATLSWSHTVGTGSDRLLIVGIGQVGSAAVSSVTFDSMALTEINTQAGNTNNCWLYYLVNPPSGTYTVTVTFTSTAYANMAGSISLTGVSQSSPVDTQGTAENNGNAAGPVDLTTTVNNDWLVDVVTTNNNATPTAASGQTVQIDLVGADNVRNLYMSTKGPVTPAGATSMSWTYVPSTGNPECAVAVAP